MVNRIGSTTHKTRIDINKVWDDDNNRDKVRPESLDVVLHSSDEEFDDVPVTLTAKQSLVNHAS